MKTIWKIFLNDFKKIRTNLIAFIVIIGLTILPALYAWFNIASNWDPYSNTKNISVAVVNNDKGGEIGPLSINIGDSIVDSLKKNDKMGWKFVSEKEAKDGITSGKYYASVYIPKDFSDCFSSILSGDLKRPEIKYTVNEKLNIIAPKITDKGAETIKTQVNTQFISTITESVASVFDTVVSKNNISISSIVDNSKKSINKVEDTIDLFDDSIDKLNDTIDCTSTLVSSVSKNSPELKSLLSNTANLTGSSSKAIKNATSSGSVISNNISAVFKVAMNKQKSIDKKLNKLLNELKVDSKTASNIVLNTKNYVNDIITLENSLIKIVNNTKDYDFDTSLKNTLTSSITSLNNLSKKLDSASTQLADTGKVTSSLVSSIKTQVTNVKDSISSVVSGLYDGMVSTVDSIADMVKSNPQSASQTISALATPVKKLVSFNGTLKNLLQSITSSTGIDTSSYTALIDKANTNLNSISEKIESASSYISTAGKVPTTLIESIDSLIKSAQTQTKSYIDGFGTSLNSELDLLVNSVSASVTEIANDLKSASTSVSKLSAFESSLLTFLNDNKISIDTDAILKGLKNSKADLTASKKLIDALASTIKNTGKLPSSIRSDIGDIISKAKKSFNAINTEYNNNIKPELNSSLSSLVKVLDSSTGLLSGVISDLPNIDKTIDNADTTLKKLKTFLTDVQDLLSKGKDKLDNFKDTLDDVKNNKTLKKFVEGIMASPEKLGDFMGSPVKVTTVKAYHVANYGSGMAPFYSTLACWVGSLVLIAMIKTDISKKDRLKIGGKIRPIQEYFGRYLIYFFMAIIQSLIISLGDLLFLNIQCKEPVIFVLVSLLTGVIFSLLLYSLTLTFSVVGKALSVIILVIQVAGSGGTYPAEVLPDFFQAILPYLPFKYSINAMRECVAGVYMPSLVSNIMYLLIYLGVALLIGIVLRRPCMRIMAFINKRLDDTELVI